MSRRPAWERVCALAAVGLVLWTMSGGCARSPRRATTGTPAMPFIQIAAGGREFTRGHGGERFVPWGFNYDHDHERARLLEDYWHDEWTTVAGDFHEMKALGANVVRVHLQVAKFMRTPTEPDARNLAQLGRLVGLAEKTGLYLNVTGLGCYHKADVPAWYDALDEAARWDVQARFWEAVAECCASSPAIFCYDLMNEPVAPAERRAPGDWLGPPFAGKHFVQFISLDPAGRDRAEVGRQWVSHLVRAIRRRDSRHLITVGLVDWSLDRPGLTSGMVPSRVGAELDFVSVHLYPRARRLAEDLETLRGFAALGKPVVIEETFPLACSLPEFAQFVEASRKDAGGWFMFYWGKTLNELGPQPRTFVDALLKPVLEYFRAHVPRENAPCP